MDRSHDENAGRFLLPSVFPVSLAGSPSARLFSFARTVLKRLSPQLFQVLKHGKDLNPYDVEAFIAGYSGRNQPMNDNADRWTLIWGSLTERPDPRLWKIGPSYNDQTAAYWSSLGQAIDYAVGMKKDRAAAGLHPWIRTPQGHVYSPATIDVMGSVIFEAYTNARRPSPARKAKYPLSA